MGFSAWKIWLHPKFTARTMDELEAESLSISEERERMKVTIDRFADLNSALEQEIAETVTKLNDALRQLDEAKEMIDSLSETESHIREFELKLSEFERMKANYERRISSLKSTIRELRAAEAGVESDSDLIEDIHLSPGSGPNVSDVKSHPSLPDEENWLDSLP